jgi:hypothetical protein
VCQVWRALVSSADVNDLISQITASIRNIVQFPTIGLDARGAIEQVGMDQLWFYGSGSGAASMFSKFILVLKSNPFVTIIHLIFALADAIRHIGRVAGTCP